MNRRVLLAGLFHETHTFLEGTTGLGAFTILRGEALLACAGDSSPLGGVLDCAREFGWQVLPVADYRALPSATVEDAVVAAFWRDFLHHAMPHLARGIDAIFLILHGAMTAQSIEDMEGEILARIRRLPGAENVPLFGVFDLHANFTPRMAALSDCLVGYRENPHTDARAAACRAARLLERCLATGAKPRQASRAAPIVWPPTGTGTASDPMKTLETMAREMETLPGIWAVSVAAGFAFADTEHTGVSFVLAGEENAPLQNCLDALCATAWAMRELGCATERPLAEVMPALASPPPGLTVLVEPADNIGGGAPGDGTGVLRALVEWCVPDCAVCLADAAAVARLAGIGLGESITLSLGGKGSRLDEGPLELEVELLSRSDGHFQLEDQQSHLASMSGDHFEMGPCAVVRHRGLTIMLTSIKTPPFDLGQWRSQGLDPARFSVIGVKAAVAHRRAYDPIAARMIWVDTPGPCRSRLASLPYRKIRRPIFPLDPMLNLSPNFLPGAASPTTPTPP